MSAHKIASLLLIFTGIVGLIGWRIAFLQSTQQLAVEPELIASASIYPVYDLVRQIAGHQYQVELILPPGLSPHDYEPDPKLVSQLQQSPFVFIIGQNLDNWITAHTGPNQTVIMLDKNIPPINNDPHYWLNTDNAATMATTIKLALIQLKPQSAREFEQNYTQLINSLTEIKNYGLTLKNSHPHINQIATFHNAYAYFASQWGLQIAASFEEYPGSEPTPAYIQNFIKQIKTHQITTIYSGPDFSPKSLIPIAADAGVTIDYLNDVGGTIDTDTYQNLIKSNLQTIFKP